MSNELISTIEQRRLRASCSCLFREDWQAGTSRDVRQLQCLAVSTKRPLGDFRLCDGGFDLLLDGHVQDTVSLSNTEELGILSACVKESDKGAHRLLHLVEFKVSGRPQQSCRRWLSGS